MVDLKAVMYLRRGEECKVGICTRQVERELRTGGNTSSSRAATITSLSLHRLNSAGSRLITMQLTFRFSSLLTNRKDMKIYLLYLR